MLGQGTNHPGDGRSQDQALSSLTIIDATTTTTTNVATSRAKKPQNIDTEPSRAATISNAILPTMNETESNTATQLSPCGLVATTFTSFPKLPLELREMVWSYALPCPEVIDISTHPYLRKQTAALLWVCRESRLGALQTYSSITVPVPEIRRPTYYSKNGNILLFSPRGRLQQIGAVFKPDQRDSAFQASVSVLAIGAIFLHEKASEDIQSTEYRSWWASMYEFWCNLCSDIKELPNLREIIVLLSEDDDSRIAVSLKRNLESCFAT